MLPQVPKEIVYVQKLHFLGFLLSLVLLISLFIGLIVNKNAGIITLFLGFLFAYGVTVRKHTFITPAKEAIARHLARKLTQPELPPVIAAAIATQLFYLLGDKDRAETLLLAFLPSTEPLVHTTLADIYLTQNKMQHALNCLEPVSKLDNPLIQWTLGKIFLRQRDFISAKIHLEKAINTVNKTGLPHNKTGFINHKFMEWSVKSSLHHSLAECHHHLGDFEAAKRFLRLGNRYLLDFSLWRVDF